MDLRQVLLYVLFEDRACQCLARGHPHPNSVSWMRIRLLYLSTDLNRLQNKDDFDTPWEMCFENIVEKEEKAGNQHFLLFPRCCFSTLRKTNLMFRVTFNLSSANVFTLDTSLRFCHPLSG